MKSIFISAAVLGALLGWFGMGVVMEQQQQRTELTLYCKMVYTHKLTNGEHGWPDYEHKYDQLCPKTGLTKF